MTAKALKRAYLNEFLGARNEAKQLPKLSEWSARLSPPMCNKIRGVWGEIVGRNRFATTSEAHPKIPIFTDFPAPLPLQQPLRTLEALLEALQTTFRGYLSLGLVKPLNGLLA